MPAVTPRNARKSALRHHRRGSRGHAKAWLTPARAGALQLTEATTAHKISVRHQRRRLVTHYSSADGVCPGTKNERFRGARKRPLAADPHHSASAALVSSPAQQKQKPAGSFAGGLADPIKQQRRDSTDTRKTIPAARLAKLRAPRCRPGRAPVCSRAAPEKAPASALHT